MAILLKNIKLYAPLHQLHMQRIDILVDKGKISKIGKDIANGKADQVINGEQLSVSMGWTDLNCTLNEPGFEFKETIPELCQSAAYGGFTDVAVMPNTYPTVDTAQAVNYIKQQASFQPVNLHPAGAFTKKTKGEELSEMLDLHKAGVRMFSDGAAQMGINAAFGRALRYLQPFNGLLVCYPEEKDLSQSGHMHEGKVSTLMGMKGIPAIAEEVAIMKALKLLEYYGGKLHFTTVSTAGAIDLIREAKTRGLDVTCDVAAYQIAFTDQAMEDFDTYLKVMPPFRTATDNEAIISGLKDGTVDALVSNHRPQDIESKQLEFDLADFGMVSLPNTFAIANTHLKNALGMSKLIEKIALAPRKLLGLPHQIAEGETAVLTIFHEDIEWAFAKEDLDSRALNSPFFGEKMSGKALGIINGEKLCFSKELKTAYLSK